jgi:hypothetical protein
MAAVLSSFHCSWVRGCTRVDPTHAGDDVDDDDASQLESQLDLAAVRKRKTFFTALAALAILAVMFIGLGFFGVWLYAYATVGRWTVESVPLLATAVILIACSLWFAVWLTPYAMWFFTALFEARMR